MDKKTVFVRTASGENEVSGKGGSLSGDLKRALFLVDDKSTFDEILKRAAPSLRAVLPDMFAQLLAGGHVRDKAKPLAEPKIAAPKIVMPTLNGELDFTGLLGGSSAPDSSDKTKADADAARAELEAAVEAAKLKARVEAEAKAAANAKLAAEIAAKNQIEAETRAKQDALVRQQAEAKAKEEAVARARAEQVAAEAKAQLEAAAQAKAAAEAAAREQIEIAARAKAEAELRAQQLAEAARLKAEQEAVRVKAELEAAARAKAEAEAARLQAEQETARARAELEAAKVKAEADAKAQAAARAQAEAEAARLQAEEAARVKAQQVAAQAKAEQEAKELADARAQQDIEAAHLRAAQEAALAKAEQEVLLAKAEAESHALAEERARQEAQAAQMQAEQETARIKAELDALKAAAAQQEMARQDVMPESSRLSPQESAQAEQERLAQAKRAADLEIAYERSKQEAQKLADEQAKAWAAAEQRAKTQAQAETERPLQPVVDAVKVAAPKQPRVRRKSLPLGKIAAGIGAAALMSLVALPYLLPLDAYVLPLEQKLSAQFKQPVHISKLHAASLPWPTLQLEQISAGAGQELQVESATLTFDLFSLFSDVKTIRSVELRGLSLAGASFSDELSWLKNVGINTSYPVSKVKLLHASIRTDEFAFPVLDGEIELGEQGKPAKVTLKSEDAKFAIELHPVQERWETTLNVKEAAFPLFPNVSFEELTAKGEMSAAGANFVEIKGQAYGGFLHGNAKLSWQKGWQLSGRIEANSVEASKLFPKLSVSGELAGNANFSTASAKLARLAEAQQMDGSFVLKKGIVNGIDMIETARGGRQNASGSRTHLDELSGNFQANSRTQRFQQLKLASGILNGSGSFDVASGGQLAGRFSVEMKARAGTSSLLLSGNLTAPLLRAGR